ncbi:protein-tyrosine phosphatase [Winogradskyella epiphytica]|uniref:protein-tyrosine-phosphatase n=1 Tax=Winogradskyella epiphytica TaxID=262005 RepID=A0A2V4XF03_9FLAO|nr:low molecular weight protein-tyrosine-phosphatase [Winogradskyella epiphytica]PYE81444.1 protein-tyrosine phosphatase [Winogradskyella epiphytica]GGW65067.1 protein-tyrosine-phosphatase [Winogradskyella epiphytica]
MTRILMVCLGNICRSPLAHGILQSKLSEDRFYVDSAGTAAYHIGKSPDKRSIAVAKDNGLDISTQSARQFKVSDFDTFDFIYVMDESNYADVIRLARNDNDKAKVSVFLNHNNNISHKNMPDPYYGDESDFKYVYQLIDETCDVLVKSLNNL